MLCKSWTLQDGRVDRWNSSCFHVKLVLLCSSKYVRVFRSRLRTSLFSRQKWRSFIVDDNASWQSVVTKWPVPTDASTLKVYSILNPLETRGSRFRRFLCCVTKALRNAFMCYGDCHFGQADSVYVLLVISLTLSRPLLPYGLGWSLFLKLWISSFSPLYCLLLYQMTIHTKYFWISTMIRGSSMSFKFDLTCIRQRCMCLVIQYIFIYF